MDPSVRSEMNSHTSPPGEYYGEFGAKVMLSRGFAPDAETANKTRIRPVLLFPFPKGRIASNDSE
jgi:hypothetical protein